MRIVLIALMVASIALPAHARGRQRPNAQQQQSAEAQKQKAKVEESAYKSALDRIPNQKPADPWGRVR